MINMTFFMIPYGAVIAYSSILAYEKEWMNILPYFYIVLVAGMLVAKFFTQKMVDAGKHRTLVTVTLVLLTATMISYIFMHSKLHMMIAAFIFGTGYGIMQPLFQSFVTGTTHLLCAESPTLHICCHMISVSVSAHSRLASFMNCAGC